LIIKRLPRWKREQIGKKRQKLFGVVRFLCLFIILLILGTGSFFYFFSDKVPLLRVSDRENFVIFGKDILIVSVSLVEKKASVVAVPAETLVTLPSPYGRYKIGAIPTLDTLEKKEGQLLLKTASRLIGIPITKWLVFPNEVSSFRSDATKNYFSLSKFFLISKDIYFQSSRTNFTIHELFRIWRLLGSLHNSEIQDIALADYDFMQPGRLADGSKVLLVDFSSLDHFLIGNFFEYHFLRDHLTIEIQNGTGYQGEALYISRLLSNMGGEVISVSNAQVPSPVTKICQKNQEFERTYTIRRLSDLFLTEAVICEGIESRADVLVIVGKDYLYR
jgi:hypothetical protein